MFTKVTILRMNCPEGETPQTEIMVQQNQNPENEFPRRETHGQKELFKKVRLAIYVHDIV